MGWLLSCRQELKSTIKQPEFYTDKSSGYLISFKIFDFCFFLQYFNVPTAGSAALSNLIISMFSSNAFQIILILFNSLLASSEFTLFYLLHHFAIWFTCVIPVCNSLVGVVYKNKNNNKHFHILYRSKEYFYIQNLQTILLNCYTSRRQSNRHSCNHCISNRINY